MSQHDYPHCALSIIPTVLGFTVMRMYNDGSGEPVRERWLVPHGELETRIAELHTNPTYSPEVIIHADHRHTEH